MELPKPADFEDSPRRVRPRITAQRLGVLALLLVGGGLLALATEYWPEGGMKKLFRPIRLGLAPSDADEIREEIDRSLQSRNVRQALLLADRLIEIDAEAGYLARARIQVVRREYDKAVDDLSKVIQKNPKNSEALRLSSAIHLHRKEFEAAIDDATKLSAIEPREGLFLRGRIHLEKKDYDKALVDLDAAIQSDPAFLDAYYLRYQVHLDRNHYEKALADASVIAETAPTKGLVLKGDVFAKQKKYDESIAAYSAAIEADPTNATAYNNRAYHRSLLRRDLDKAAADVAAAIELSGEEPAYVDTRGYVAYLKGNFKSALKDFDAAIEGVEKEGIDPSIAAEIYFHRGLVHQKLGEEKLSKQDFAKAKELGFEWSEMPEPVGKEL